jgi:hypothetical protein
MNVPLGQNDVTKEYMIQLILENTVFVVIVFLSMINSYK